MLLGKQKNAPRRDVRLNDVNCSVVATSLLGNSRYQTWIERKIIDPTSYPDVFLSFTMRAKEGGKSPVTRVWLPFLARLCAEKRSA